MPLLEETIATIVYPGSREWTAELLRAKLGELGITVESRTPTHLTAKCLALCANYVLWRCWSNRLELRLEESAPQRTTVTIVAVPDLFRFRTYDGERVHDLDLVVRVLET